MIPINIEIKNFFSHKDSAIDFTQFDSALLIGNVDGNYDISNGSGKCLDGSTILTDAFTGERVAVKDLHENFKEFYVWGLDEDLKLRPTLVIATQVSGIKDMLEIKTSSGFIEKVSKTHPVMTASLKCMPADLLSEGDFIARPRSLPVLKSDSLLSIAESRLLGLYAAEGGLTGNSINFTNMDEEIISQARADVREVFDCKLSNTEITYRIAADCNKKEVRKEILDRLHKIGVDIKAESPNNWPRILKLEHSLNFNKLKSFGDCKINKLAGKLSPAKASRNFLREHGLLGSLAKHKRIPPDIFKESSKNVGAFIGMFFSGDGYIADVSSGHYEISIGLASELMISDFQVLLQRFGINTSIRFKKVANKFDSWILNIHTNKSNFIRFYNLIEGHIYGPKKDRFSAFYDSAIAKVENHNKDLVPSATYYDTIVSMKPIICKEMGLNLSRAQLKNTNMSREKLQKYARFFNNNKLKNLANSDIYWDRVKEVTSIGPAETYDIQVSNSTHLYALNGFITHNSAIFESILWCLFNKSRVGAMDDIVFWGENSCKVSFIFKHGGDLYQVVRKRSRINSVSNVTFYRQDMNGNWIDISGSTPSLTNKEITDTIKIDYKTFVNSAYFRQNDISEFAETDASRKKGILKSIIDLSKWDAYEKQAKSGLRELKSECNILGSKLEGFETIIKSHDLAKLALKTSQKFLNDETGKRDLMRENLRNMISKYQSIKDTLDTNRWDKIVEELGRLNAENDVVSRKSTSAKSSLITFKNKVKTLTDGIEFLTKTMDALETDEKADEEIDAVNDKVVELRSTLSVSNTMLGELSDREIHKGKCYVCNQDVGDELYDSLVHDHTGEISKHKRNRVYSQNKLNELTTKMRKLKLLSDNNKKSEKYLSNIKAKNMELNIAKERTEELSAEDLRLVARLASIKADIDLNNKVLDSIRNDDFRSLQRKIATMRRTHQSMNEQVESKNRELGSLTEKAANLKAKIVELKMTKIEYLKKKKEIAVIDKMVKLFGKNGIQTILLNAVIEDLENTANEILTSICNEPFIIYLDTQRVGSDGISVVDTLDLRVKKDGIIQNFKSLSGGEQFRISLALRIALSEISSRHGGSSLEFLLLDEINSPLDKQGTESLFINVIRSLEKKYKILVITHSDTLKEKFDNVIDVTKINGESTINFISI